MKTLFSTAIYFFFCSIFLNAQHVLTIANKADTITFNNYDGTGFSPAPTTTQLSSAEWSVRGLSDGNLYFGGTKTTGDFARGISPGGVGTGGIYAFEVTSGDKALGIQPIDADFTPGDFILQLQNKTGDVIQDLTVAYDLYIHNDKDRSSSFIFFHGKDTLHYQQEHALNMVTTETAEVAPSWKKVSLSVTIKNIALANNHVYYLRWNSDDVGGSGSRDELALDNIILTPFTPPVKAGFSVPSSGLCLNIPVCFTDMSSALSPDTIRSWNWSFGDNDPDNSGSSTMKNPCFTYAFPGTHTVYLQVETGSGKRDSTSIDIQVGNVPLPSFTTAPVCEGDTTCFKNTSLILNDNIVSYHWDFGDTNGVSIVRNPCYLYKRTGNYPVTLTTVSDLGCRDSVTNTVIVSPLPVADFSFIINANTVQFTDESSGAVAWSWFFDDLSGNNNTSTLQHPSHTYSVADAGVRVCLATTNLFGCNDSICKDIFPNGITPSFTQPSIRLIPTGEKGSYNIVTNNAIHIDAISVTDATGRLLLYRDGEAVNNNRQLTFAGFTEGIYFVKMMTTTGVVSEKIILAH